MSEDGRITNVSFPGSAKKGAEITVTTTVKNTGSETAEFRVYLKNAEGITIDKEPDTYRSVVPGQSTTIRTSTHWDPRWAMPGHDWNNLRVELWEIDLFGGDDRLDARVFSIKLDTTMAENGKITDVTFPAKARKGSEIEVLTTAKNTGTATAEFRVYLKNAEGITIDKEPDTYRSVKPGQSATIKTSTHWDPRWAMPGHDWNNLRVELWEIDLVGSNDRLDARVFSITHKAVPGEVPIPPPPPPGEEEYIPPPEEEPFVVPPPGEEEYTPPSGYDEEEYIPSHIEEITTQEAEERYESELPCYIKCTLPILDMLPGIPYTPGMWIPPFCAISTTP